MAFAALINPDELEDDCDHMKPIVLMDEERENMFMSAMLVTNVQIATIILISIYFRGLRDKGKFIKPAPEFAIIVPRLLSSIMMHL